MGQLTPEDTRRVLQLVGFYEYGNALFNFNHLLKNSTDEELEAMDNIVRRRPEFTVYTNLSDAIQTGPSSLSTSARYRNESERFTGFRGVIALARTEFGAMLAGFTDAPQPFQFLPLHPFDAEEYQQLLLDGARSHYWALLKDPRLKKVTTTSPENPIVLAYSRRLVVARSMLSAATRLGRARYKNVQMRELMSWKESLDDVQHVLVGNIQLFLRDLSEISAQTRTNSTKYTDACQAMLRAERRMNSR